MVEKKVTAKSSKVGSGSAGKTTVKAAEPKSKAPVKAKEAKIKAIEITGKYLPALGRRKEATAQVRLFVNGSGQVIVNDKDLKVYFPSGLQQQSVLSPFAATGTENQFDVTVRVVGGGMHGQADSVRLGIARALVKHNEDFRTTLRQAGFLTRDARKKERKKYGKKSARRSPQWAKR
ncbi:30S ribosomal protein S9 [Patescibacteria group bacterium]|nr:30S ribosomal protein S9 [Patescibacteria group bacterium]MBU1705398.1 30S ribosomal protein S9 [Patescibacteria group bacterium]